MCLQLYTHGERLNLTTYPLKRSSTNMPFIPILSLLMFSLQENWVTDLKAQVMFALNVWNERNMIIWRGMFTAWSQILERWVVRANMENLLAGFWCNFVHCLLVWSSCASLSMERIGTTLHRFLGGGVKKIGLCLEHLHDYVHLAYVGNSSA